MTRNPKISLQHPALASVERLPYPAVDRSGPVRVAVLTDDAMMRAGVQRLLAQAPEVEVVAEAEAQVILWDPGPDRDRVNPAALPICLRAFAFLDMHCCNPRPIESAIRCMATQVVCTRQRGQFAGSGNPGGEPLTILWDSHDGSTSAASVPPTYMAISVAAYAVRPA